MRSSDRERFSKECFFSPVFSVQGFFVVAFTSTLNLSSPFGARARALSLLHKKCPRSPEQTENDQLPCRTHSATPDAAAAAEEEEEGEEE